MIIIGTRTRRPVNAGLVKCPRCSLNVDPSTHVVDGDSCREAWLERLMGWSHD